MADPRQIVRADVFKGDALAGVITRLARGEIAFTYAPDYLTGDGEPVAITLPPSTETFIAVGGAVPPFFAGLLPEGARLNALVTRVKTSPDDMLSLLLAVGSDTIGDVRVVPAGVDPVAVTPHAVGPWTALDFDELFAESVGTHGDHAALPGVQAKVSAAVISFPVARGGGRSILKLNPPEYPHLVENESFFLAAARTSGLDAADAELVYDRNGRAGLLVRRFDRVARRAAPDERVWQEDGCQVLGLYPADKYRVSAEDVVTAIANHCAAPIVAALDLTRQLVFGYLIGNGDIHAKNLSLFRDPRRGLFTPTPAYDVLSTAAYPHLNSDTALPVGGRSSGLTRARWLEFGDGLGARPRALAATIDQLLAAAPEWLPDLELIGFDQRRTHELRRGIEHRRDELAA